MQIRWMIRQDTPRALEIEAESFDNPWDEEQFLACLRQRNCIANVVESDGLIVGFMIYELHKTYLRILDLAVSTSHRRQGAGRKMVEKLLNKLSQQKRTSLIVEVRESNLAAQLFFRECGLRALAVLRNHYEDVEEDAYRFAYVLPVAAHAAMSW